MPAPAISLIVPTFNAAPFLREFCESVVAQTCGDFEVLIGDDGSTDDSLAVLQPFLADPRFRYFSWKPNRGVHHGTVFLLQQARGAFWCSPGADDVLLPHFLERRLAQLAAHPEAVLVHGPGHWIDENGAPIRNDTVERAWPILTERIPEALPAERMLRLLLQHNFINIPSALIRTDVTRLVLPHFTPHWRWALDWALWILLAATGFDFLWDREPLHHYRVHSGSNSASPDPARERIRRMEKKLVPLCTLHAASQFSPLAKAAWIEHRTALYRRWLVTAAQLWAKGTLSREAHLAAVAAHRGALAGLTWFPVELLRHGVAAALQVPRENRAMRGQLFRVSGLPLIDDPLLRN